MHVAVDDAALVQLGIRVEQRAGERGGGRAPARIPGPAQPGGMLGHGRAVDPARRDERFVVVGAVQHERRDAAAARALEHGGLVAQRAPTALVGAVAQQLDRHVDAFTVACPQHRDVGQALDGGDDRQAADPLRFRVGIGRPAGDEEARVDEPSQRGERAVEHDVRVRIQLAAEVEDRVGHRGRRPKALQQRSRLRAEQRRRGAAAGVRGRELPGARPEPGLHGRRELLDREDHDLRRQDVLPVDHGRAQSSGRGAHRTVSTPSWESSRRAKSARPALSAASLACR